MTVVHATHAEVEGWLHMRRAAQLTHQRLFAKVMAMLPVLEILPATVPLLDAAIADPAALADMLNGAIAPGWEGFPEALPILRESLLREPTSPWGTSLFVFSAPRTLVGMGGFKGPPCEGVVEIGYAIAPSFQKRGLASEAARQLIARAFADTRVTAVDAHTLGEHNGSTRVLEKVGMRRVGELRDAEHGSIWHWRIARAP